MDMSISRLPGAICSNSVAAVAETSLGPGSMVMAMLLARPSAATSAAASAPNSISAATGWGFRS